jgi:hypothetical protein
MTDLWIENQIRSKDWKPKTQGFMIDGRSGYAEFASVYIAGAITVTAGGTVGGWTVGANDLSSGNVSLNSLTEQILLGSATDPSTGVGIFIGKDGSDYELRAGDPAGDYIHWDGSGLTINGPVISDLSAGSEVAIQEWTYTGAFSALDADSIQWTGGTLTLAATGETFAINAGATGDMTGFNYIYLDRSVSVTDFQVSTSFTAGSGKMIIATAQNGTTEASFMMMGGEGSYNLDGGNIAAESIIAGKLSVTELSAVTANMGTLNAGKIAAGSIEINADTERILFGSATAPLTGVGIFQGKHGADYEFRVGDPSDAYVHWDGSGLTIEGTTNDIARFGGDGSDGALSITSGTTTIDISGVKVLERDYTSISITGTGKLAFSNSHNTGTLVYLKSQGDVTLTSSKVPMLDCSAIGAAGGAAINTANSGFLFYYYSGNDGADGAITPLETHGALRPKGEDSETPDSAPGDEGVGGAAIDSTAFAGVYGVMSKYSGMFVGGGGSSGGKTLNDDGDTTKYSGKGGNGGGALVIECGGALNFTTANGVSVAGEAGGNGDIGGDGFPTRNCCGGGGGGGGSAVIFYNELTSFTGSVRADGGVGGLNSPTLSGGTCYGGGGGGSGENAGTNGTTAGGGVTDTKTGGNGGGGYSLVAKNTYYA